MKPFIPAVYQRTKSPDFFCCVAKNDVIRGLNLLTNVQKKSHAIPIDYFVLGYRVERPVKP